MQPNGKMLDNGAAAQRLSMRTHNRRVVSSILSCVIFKTPLVRKATGSHLMNSTSLEKTQSLVSATLEIEYATQYASQVVLLLLFLLITNIYTGFFYRYIMFTQGKFIYCYHT